MFYCHSRSTEQQLAELGIKIDEEEPVVKKHSRIVCNTLAPKNDNSKALQITLAYLNNTPLDKISLEFDIDIDDCKTMIIALISQMLVILDDFRPMGSLDTWFNYIESNKHRLLSDISRLSRLRDYAIAISVDNSPEGLLRFHGKDLFTDTRNNQIFRERLYTDLSLVEIGQKFDLSRSRVDQIVKKSLRKLYRTLQNYADFVLPVLDVHDNTKEGFEAKRDKWVRLYERLEQIVKKNERITYVD